MIWLVMVGADGEETSEFSSRGLGGGGSKLSFLLKNSSEDLSYLVSKLELSFKLLRAP